MSQQPKPDNPGKGYLEELNYIGNIRHGSSNPVYISHAPHGYADFSVSYGNNGGEFHRPDDALRARNWNGDIYGILKMGRIAFEGSITYDNDRYFDKKWSSKLFLSHDNPFFLGDILTADYESQKFRLRGGFSYSASPGLSAGIMADYSVGILSDQLDPRGESKGIRFMVNPGVQYEIGNFTGGLSATVGKEDEYHQFMKKGSITSAEYLYFFRGLVNPELHSVLPSTWPKIEYTDFIYGGAFQFCWDNKKGLADFLEVRYTRSSAESTDATDYVRKNSGDYIVTKYGITNRFRIAGERAVHNISVHAGSESGDGVSYVLDFRNDEEGQPVWWVAGKSITYTHKSLEGGLAYRLDLMKAGIPTLTLSVGGNYNDTDKNHYPEGYFERYGSASFCADIAKYFSIGENMLKIKLSGGYVKNLSESSDHRGITTEKVMEYFENEFAYSISDYYSASVRADYHHSLNVSGNGVSAGIFAEGCLYKHTGKESVFSGKSRHGFRIGLNLIF